MLMKLRSRSIQWKEGVKCKCQNFSSAKINSSIDEHLHLGGLECTRSHVTAT